MKDPTFEMLVVVGALCLLAWGALRIGGILFDRKYGQGDHRDR